MRGILLSVVFLLSYLPAWTSEPGQALDRDERVLKKEGLTRTAVDPGCRPALTDQARLGIQQHPCRTERSAFRAPISPIAEIAPAWNGRDMDFAIPPPSLYPWFGEEVRVFEKKLLGKWQGENGVTIKFRRGRDNTYDIKFVEDSRRVSRLSGALGQIDGIYYLDVVIREIPEEEARELEFPDWGYAVHILLAIEIEERRFRANGPIDDKMEELVETDQLLGCWIPGEGLVIVSKTYALEAFLAEQGQANDLWGEFGAWIQRM